jgi:hypothetical protein
VCSSALRIQSRAASAASSRRPGLMVKSLSSDTPKS